MSEDDAAGPGGGKREDDAGASGRPLSRRQFIGGAAGLAGTAYLASFSRGKPLWLSQLNPFRVLAAAAGTIKPPSEVPDFAITAERDTDLVLLDFEFYGFSLQRVKGVATLVPTMASAAGTAAGTSNIVVVGLPPQCVGEAAYPVDLESQSAQSYGATAPLPVDAPPIVSAVGGPSRLVFTLPTGVEIPLPNMAAEDLLDWSKWALVVPTTAQINPPGPVGATPGAGPKGYPLPYQPGPFETAIEFPYALFIAPVVYVAGDSTRLVEGARLRLPLSESYDTYFTSRTRPLFNGTIADLWTADLARGNSEAGLAAHLPTPLPQVGAVWASDMYFTTSFAPPPPSATEADEIYYQQAQPK